MAVNPEKQATVMIRDQSRTLLTSLKEEVDKKNEVIQHQDKLLKEYRESLDIREQEIDSLRRKITFYDDLVTELRNNPPTAGDASTAEKPKSKSPSKTDGPIPEPVTSTPVLQTASSAPQYSEYQSNTRNRYMSVRQSTTGWQRFLDWWRYG